ncbi:heme-binding protein [Mesorhizobium sp. M3A.F.Ca.ET.080.04.2.1]|nr:heme-binding protein [Mesorhizobium sp. M3A.F.Ca.ET.080.04.2.1]RWB67956.1 MAG: heme-binding protein [Mesorhizobium sp.]RWB87712.1 MAG: heme-binding protein [Mesorhizobium sp.]RWE30376.1 MAG: heme-binding protein [Mesorhizobium sp.]
MDRRRFLSLAVSLVGLAIGLLQHDTAWAQAPCPADHDKLLSALKASVKASGGPANGGFETNEWAAIVARDGTVCAVAFSGPSIDAQWPGSRLIAAEKANTANGLSLAQMALSTANLYAGVQPGGPLFGLQATNPVNLAAAFAGEARTFGSVNDPLIGKPIGGVVVFGGGLALYDGKTIVGGLGISGDSSCADHNVAWRVRAALGLDKVPAGVNPNRKDAIVYDLDAGGKSASGWGHPLCAGKEADIAAELGAGVGGSVAK